jgi:5'-nucleotidase / UDP-sugar diphosphatase
VIFGRDSFSVGGVKCFRPTLRVVLLAILASRLIAATGSVEALLVIAADQHSAYERTAQFVAHVDRLRGENPGVPLAILIDGDAFEYGNAIARRTAGAIDFAMFAALARRAPTIVNLGNHEPEFHDVAETVARLRAAGVTVISGNLRDRATSRAFAAASTRLRLGSHEMVVAGLGTDRLATYRVAIRPQLDLAEPVAWAKQNLPTLLKGAAFPIVLSHAGLKADREILALVPDGTLFAGAHDHLRFVHRSGRTVYFHSGSWMEFISIARLERDERGLHWTVEQTKIADRDPADPALAKLIRETLAQHLTAEETAVVGRTKRALAPSEAAAFAVEAARRAAHADVAVIGATTFGAGLPEGDVSRFALDACVRFDGTLFVGEIDGVRLKKILARANQGPDKPFTDRAGENLVAIAPAEIVPTRTYRLVTTDWVARNAANYLGENPPALTEQPDLKLKPAVTAALHAYPLSR